MVCEKMKESGNPPDRHMKKKRKDRTQIINIKTKWAL